MLVLIFLPKKIQIYYKIILVGGAGTFNTHAQELRHSMHGIKLKKLELGRSLIFEGRGGNHAESFWLVVKKVSSY